jgi:hypothetical protein
MKESSTPNRRVHRSPEQWQSLVDQFEQSDLSQRAFCQQKRLAYGTFSRWRRRLLARNAESDEQSNPAFVELLGSGTQGNHNSGWDVELQLGEGITLRLRRQPC